MANPDGSFTATVTIQYSCLLCGGLPVPIGHEPGGDDGGGGDDDGGSGGNNDGGQGRIDDLR